MRDIKAVRIPGVSFAPTGAGGVVVGRKPDDPALGLNDLRTGMRMHHAAICDKAPGRGKNGQRRCTAQAVLSKEPRKKI